MGEKPCTEKNFAKVLNVWLNPLQQGLCIETEVNFLLYTGWPGLGNGTVPTTIHISEAVNQVGKGLSQFLLQHKRNFNVTI